MEELQKQRSKEYSLVDFFVNILKKKSIIIVFSLVGLLVGLTISLLLPKQYITFASIKASSSNAGSFSSLLKGSNLASGMGALSELAFSGGSEEIDYLQAIIESRSVQDSMIKKFNLKNSWKFKTIEDTREELKNLTEFNADLQSQILLIGIYAESPQLAAKMTNYYLYLLNQKYMELNSQAAKNNRVHLEKRYQEVINTLSLFEDSLKAFQNRTGAIDIESQISESIKSAALLKQAIIEKEIELISKKQILNNESPELNIIRSQIAELSHNYNTLINGSQKLDFVIPFKNTPDIALKYFRLEREIKVHSELLKVLLPMLEQTKFQELKETPSIVVIDKGIPPEKKSKPKRMLITLLGLIGGFAIGFVIVLFKVNSENIKKYNPESYEKLNSALRFRRSNKEI